MDTKQKGDIAEQAVTLKALKLGWGVLRPVGDRLAYDLVFDINGCLLKVQVKSAWYDTARNNYVVDNRRTKTNRRQMVRACYCEQDFDFAIVYIDDLDLFYVFPVAVFIAYGSEIHLIVTDKRQRKPLSADYKDAWKLITERATLVATLAGTSVKLGEACSVVIPSQAPNHFGEGVETEWQTS